MIVPFGLMTAIPLEADVTAVIVSGCPSGSPSFSNTGINTGISSEVNAVSSPATGGKLADAVANSNPVIIISIISKNSCWALISSIRSSDD